MTDTAPPAPRGSYKELVHPGPSGEMAVQVGPPRSSLRALRVCAVAPAVVAPLIVQEHYLHSMPGVVRSAYGVYLAERLVGAVVLTAGARHAHRLLEGAEPRHVLTLSRFWLADELPPNGESRVLGIVLRSLARSSEAKLVVSFADPAAGHLGVIYQAAGFLYLGQTEAERFLELDGRLLHPRSAYERYGSNSARHLRRTGIPVLRRITVPKHRYAYLLDPAWRWRLRRLPQVYPKRGGRSPPARAGPERQTACGERSLLTGQTERNALS